MPPTYCQKPPFESKDSKSAVMAGTAGFEPANVGVKGRCLTAWRRPCIRLDCMEPVLIFITRCIKQRVTWFHMGWVKGLEPSTLGTTIRCSNQLSYTHHIKFAADGNGTPGGIRTPGLLLRRQLLYPAELLAHIQEPSENGAGEGNRTLVPSLEGWYSTIELHPQAIRAYHYPRRMSRVPERKTLKIRRGMEKFLSDQP